MATDAIFEERGSHWWQQISAVVTTWWSQHDQTLPVLFPGSPLSNDSITTTRVIIWFTDSLSTLNHCRFLHMETGLIVYSRTRHSNHKYWPLIAKWILVFLGRFQLHLTLKLLHIYHKTKLCSLLNAIGGPLAQLDETGEVWPGSNQLSLFNLFIVSHILHICSEYICVLYNRNCSFKHSPELCLGARAWTVLGSSRLNCAWELEPELLSLLACKLITVPACARRYGYVIVYGVDVCGGDFSKVLHRTLMLFWEKRGVVFKHLCQRQTGCSFLYVSRHYCSSPRTQAICAGELQ